VEDGADPAGTRIGGAGTTGIPPSWRHSSARCASQRSDPVAATQRR
jgi:hypothetical protein